MANCAAALPSWRDSAAREAIAGFVEGLDASGVDPAERVAVFDNDGTLWCEKPMPIQLDFLLRRFARQAQEDPSLRTRQPWKAAYEKDFGWLGGAITAHYHGDDADLGLLVKAVGQAFKGQRVEAYLGLVRDFFAAAEHPSLGRTYRACLYQPMIELLRYLESEGFTTYIASGGDREFMRAVADDLYEISPERVIGSNVSLEYTDDGSLRLGDELELFDDGPVKPVRIWSRIGRRPLVSVGNSNGDIPMLEFAGNEGGPALRLLVRHDDANREFAYDSGSEDALKLAADRGWTTVSMKNDWSTVFAGVE